MVKRKSTSGKGFVYNLILFAEHYENVKRNVDLTRESDEFKGGYIPKVWFRNLAEHFEEFQIPKKFEGKPIEKFIRSIERRVHKFHRDENYILTEKVFDKLILDIEKLGILIDKELGMTDIEATFN